MAWQPEDGPLSQLAGYLRDSLNGYNHEVRKGAEEVGCPELNMMLILCFPFVNGANLCGDNSRC